MKARLIKKTNSPTPQRKTTATKPFRFRLDRKVEVLKPRAAFAALFVVKEAQK